MQFVSYQNLEGNPATTQTLIVKELGTDIDRNKRENSKFLLGYRGNK